MACGFLWPVTLPPGDETGACDLPVAAAGRVLWPQLASALFLTCHTTPLGTPSLVTFDLAARLPLTPHSSCAVKYTYFFFNSLNPNSSAEAQTGTQIGYGGLFWFEQRAQQRLVRS